LILDTKGGYYQYYPGRVRFIQIKIELIVSIVCLHETRNGR
jgi:hypothetical protein